MTSIYRGDDTNAFGGNFLKISLNNPNNKFISKAEFRCGAVFKSFENPMFPLLINLNADETNKLQQENKGYLAIYDELGRKKTIETFITINSKGKVV